MAHHNDPFGWDFSSNLLMKNGLRLEHSVYFNEMNITATEISTAGFIVTGCCNDVLKCESCSLSVTQIAPNTDMKMLHSQKSPDCQFVRSCLNSTCEAEDPFPYFHLFGSESELPTPKKDYYVPLWMTLGRYSCELLAGFYSPVMAQPEKRKQSFQLYPHLGLASKAVVLLVAAGFFWQGTGNVIVCCGCGIKLVEWEAAMDKYPAEFAVLPDPLTLHAQRAASCPFLVSAFSERQIRQLAAEYSTCPPVDAEVPPQIVKSEVVQKIYESAVVQNVVMHPSLLDDPDDVQLSEKEVKTLIRDRLQNGKGSFTRECELVEDLIAS